MRSARVGIPSAWSGDEVKGAGYLGTIFKPMKCQAAFRRGHCYLVNNRSIISVVLLPLMWCQNSEKLSKEDTCPSGGQSPLHSRHLCTHSLSHTHRAPTPIEHPQHTPAGIWGLAAGRLLGPYRSSNITHSLSFCVCFSYRNLVSLKDLISPWKIYFCLLPPT